MDDVDCQSMEKEETTDLDEPLETPLLQTSLSNTYRSQTAASILDQLSAASQKWCSGEKGNIERTSNTLNGERSGEKTKRKTKRRMSFDAK